MTNETKELKTYTMQELYKQPLEPVEYLVDGLLAPGLYILAARPKWARVGWRCSCASLCAAESLSGACNAEKARCSTWRWRTAHSGCTAGLSAGGRGAGRAASLPPGGTHRARAGTSDRSAAGGTPAHPACCAGHAAKGAARERQRYVLQQRLRGCGALKALADRNGICLLVIHHLRKMADDDPFNALSGTNGLTGAADGTLILMRNRRQDGTATLYATGRDIEDVEEELEFADCRWSRAVPQEQLQLAFGCECPEKNCWRRGGVPGNSHRAGSATGKNRATIGARRSFPNICKAVMMCWLSVGYCWETKRTNSKRLLCLRYGDTCDTSDGSDGCDRHSYTEGVPSLPSPASRPSLAS